MYTHKPEETAEQIEALAESMKRYKELRRKQKEFRRGVGHSNVAASPGTAGAATSIAVSLDSDHATGEVGDHSTKEEKIITNGSNKVRKIQITKMPLNEHNHITTVYGFLCMCLIFESSERKH